MSSKAQQSEATRRKLLRVGRDQFARRGFAGVSTEEIVRRAGVTRGALYHHFRDKCDLFAAVVEEVEQDVMERVAAAALAETDPWDQQRAAIGAYLDVCLEPAVQRIVLTDAPSVLGLSAWREIEAKYGLALVQAGLQSVIDAGYLEPQPVEPLAHLFLGALTEGGLVIARADDREAARREVGEGIDRILGGLRKGAVQEPTLR
jgi:AcrR family transcriptional regulator